jgi:hypothetical protein
MELGTDAEPFFRRHAADFRAFDFLGFFMIGEDTNRTIHDSQRSTAQGRGSRGAGP